MVNGSRFYRALESINITSALSTVGDTSKVTITD